MADRLQKGFECTCGKKHWYPVYVYGHWREELNFTCPCGVAWKILEGTASSPGRTTVAKQLWAKDFEK